MPDSFFDKAMEHTFGREGGFTGQHGLEHDSGGPTNLGVTLATLKQVLRLDVDGDGFLDGDITKDGVIDWKDVAALPRDVARDRIYKPWYWDAPGLGGIRSQTLATKAFDLGVNAGPRVAVALLQRAVNEAKPPGVQRLKIDGRLGPLSLTAISRCDEDLLLHAFCAEQASFYLGIIEAHPEKDVFRKNWLRRAAWPLSERLG